MGKVTTTFITTCLNEEKSIEKFLLSLYKQTKRPDEIIIADGGSTDNTISCISDFKFKLLNVKVITKLGNRSVGRNAAIESSSSEIIVCSDVGCELSVNWLERITKPFEKKNIDVVAGFYKPITNSVFEKCLATYTCTMPDKLKKENFLPSSRSVAFTKKVWKKVGGYPEKLDTCEDLVLDIKLKAAGCRFVTEDKALVYWPQRENIWQAAKQFFSYAVGDGQARYFRKNTYLLFTRYIAGIILLSYILISKNYSIVQFLFLLVVLYIAWALWKNYKYVKNLRALYILPLLQFISDISVIIGTTLGLIKGLR